MSLATVSGSSLSLSCPGDVTLTCLWSTHPGGGSQPVWSGDRVNPGFWEGLLPLECGARSLLSFVLPLGFSPAGDVSGLGSMAVPLPTSSADDGRALGLLPVLGVLLRQFLSFSRRMPLALRLVPARFGAA